MAAVHTRDIEHLVGDPLSSEQLGHLAGVLAHLLPTPDDQTVST
jgi:hypothetical protein